MKVTYFHFCCILLISQTSFVQCGRRLQGFEYQEAASLGTILKALVTTVLLVFFIVFISILDSLVYLFTYWWLISSLLEWKFQRHLSGSLLNLQSLLPDNKYCRKSKYMNELHGKVLKVTNQHPFLLSKFIFITLVCDYVKSWLVRSLTGQRHEVDI